MAAIKYVAVAVNS